MWTDSTLLYAVARIQELAGDRNGALIVTMCACGLAAASALVARHPKALAGVAIGAAMVVFAAVSAGATSFDHEGSTAAFAGSFSGSGDWIDAAKLGPVTLLETPGGSGGDAMEQMFWNSSLDRVALLPSAASIDSFAAAKVTVAANGTLLAGGRALAGPLLIDEFRTWVALRSDRLIEAQGLYQLVRPHGTARMSIEVVGLLEDGWLARDGLISVWPQPTSTRLSLRLSLPVGARSDTLLFQDTSVTRVLHLAGGESRVVSFVLPRRRAAAITFANSSVTGVADGELVTLRADRPRLTPVGAARQQR